MKKIFNGTEFRTCSFVPFGESQRVRGLYIHDLSDEFGSGDGVIGNGCESVPEDAEQASDWLWDEYIETDGSVLETVIFDNN